MSAITITARPMTNARLENGRRSTSGSATRPWRTTNATRQPTPTASATAAIAKPPENTVDRPYSRPTSARLIRQVEATSSRGLVSSGRIRHHGGRQHCRSQHHDGEHCEQLVPVAHRQHEPCDNRAERRAERGHGAHHAHVRARLALRRHGQRQVHADGHDHARAERLHHAPREQRGEASRHEPDQGSGKQQRKRDHRQALRGNAAVEEPGHGHHDGGGQHVGGRDPLHGAGAHRQVVHDGREGHVEERLVERGKERGERDGEQDGPGVADRSVRHEAAYLFLEGSAREGRAGGGR